MVEIGQVEKQIAAEQLQPATGVRRIVVQQRAAHRIGDPRGLALRPAVLPVRAMSGDQECRGLGAVLGDAPQCGNIGRIVLTIAV
jgi:hypothetical protein